MLKFQQFDIKTGKTLTEYDPETDTQVPRDKQVEHSYLEHWLDKHDLKTSAQLYVANFYEGVSDRDRLKLEADDRILVFTNGKKGYFTDAVTASLMVHGDAERGINPIYAANQDAAHNMVAYGSLVSSDGMASTVRRDVRILVIDDEQRDPGEAVLDWAGEQLADEDLARILDKMGDGTMLVSSELMQALRTEAEMQAGVDLKQTVTQFRAASPDFPGMAKGTLGTSAWCEYLAVDVIVARNDIKGNDGCFSTPGIKTLSEFWLNRKSDGEYGQQSVGAQVKGTLPEATIAEFNPETQRKGEALAAVANDPLKLAAAYVQAKDRGQRQQTDESGSMLADEPVDRMAALLKADPHGLLVGFERINRELERFLRQERIDLATHGIEVPSAMAQHHNALKPWEVANKDLPQGAIVAYYRSPFANIGSAAIGVNNHRQLRWADEEAHDKAGVAYLHPWTAKQVAVTDFDKDTNGYFVGFVPTDGDEKGIGSKVAAYLRAQLADVETLSLAEQYEAGRAAIYALIEDYYANPESALIRPADYPIAVTEIIEKNAPEQKPPDIIKTQKIKHDWAVEQESHSAATWRAWAITANNPTGRVANAAMNLRSFALETQYIPDEQAEGLLLQISHHYQTVMAEARSGKVMIPSDQELQARGYPAYQFADRIAAIAQAGGQLQQLRDPGDRAQFTREQLHQVHQLLTDFVDGPMAENLQTAVDVAKSQRGIDENVYQLSRQLAYKPHELRANLKDPTIYQDGKLMPTNTQEPIGWGVEQANALYCQSQLLENPHHSYYNLLPNIATKAQQQVAKDMAQRFNQLQQQGVGEKNIDRTSRANQQPTLTFITSKGNQFTVQCPLDTPDQVRSPVWDAQDGMQPDWTITIQANVVTQWHPEPYKAYLQIGNQQRQWELGYIAKDGAMQANGAAIDLRQQLKQHGGKLIVHAPQLIMTPPIVDQPPAIVSFQKAQDFLQQQTSQLSPAERQVMAGALWHHAETISAAITGFLPEITTALAQQQLPRLKITGLQYNRAAVAQLQSGELAEIKLLGRMSAVMQEHPKTGRKEARAQEKMDAFLVGQEGALQQIGTISDRDLRLPSGTVLKGHLELRDDTLRSFEFEGETVVVRQVDRYDAKGRIFDDTPVTLSFTMSEAGMMLVNFQEDEKLKTLGVIKTADAQKIGLSSQTVIESRIQQHWPDRMNSMVGTLIVAEILSQERPIVGLPVAESQAIAEPAFHPNRADLRDWYQAIIATSSNQDPRLGEVQALGKQLNQAFCAEQGLPMPTEYAQVPTPIDYWHPQVVLTRQQNQARQAVLERARQLLQVKERGAIER